MQEQLIKLKTENGGYLALWKINSKESQSNKNIVLTHGTFSNRKVLNGIAQYLVAHQFTCWIFEWRNHGDSSRQKENFDFETIGEQDFKYVFNYLFVERHIEQIDCITHSGGGICLTIALVNQPQFQNRINSISMFACQAFGAANSRLNYAKIYFTNWTSKIVGSIPAKKIGGEENESYYLMKQWFDWNLTREFKGKSGVNYKEKMKKISVPILSIYGAGDTFIAPPTGCQQFLAAFENPHNKSLLCAKANGYSENYNHSRILHSKNASREIYPTVLEWIIQNENITRQ